MAASTQIVQVPSTAALDATIPSYVAQGYVVSNRTATSVLLFKKKEFSVLWAVIGLVLCIIPLLIYLIVYATQSDKMVEIRVVEHAALGAAGGDLRWSDDRQFWWDGSAWQRASETVPPNAQRSPDGAHWWDGAQWRPVPGGRVDVPTPAPRQDGDVEGGAPSP